jgi:1,4-dihydroxy-2-naphthoate octaprenyltransferase
MGAKGAGIVYSALYAFLYIWIIGAVIFRIMPIFALLVLFTLPMAIKAIRGALNSEDKSKFMPAMGSNVIMILLLQLLLGIGYILSKVLMV